MIKYESDDYWKGRCIRSVLTPSGVHMFCWLDKTMRDVEKKLLSVLYIALFTCMMCIYIVFLHCWLFIGLDERTQVKYLMILNKWKVWCQFQNSFFRCYTPFIFITHMLYKPINTWQTKCYEMQFNICSAAHAAHDRKACKRSTRPDICIQSLNQSISCRFLKSLLSSDYTDINEKGSAE